MQVTLGCYDSALLSMWYTTVKTFFAWAMLTTKYQSYYYRYRKSLVLVPIVWIKCPWADQWTYMSSIDDPEPLNYLGIKQTHNCWCISILLYHLASHGWILAQIDYKLLFVGSIQTWKTQNTFLCNLQIPTAFWNLTQKDNDCWFEITFVVIFKPLVLDTRSASTSHTGTFP